MPLRLLKRMSVVSVIGWEPMLCINIIGLSVEFCGVLWGNWEVKPHLLPWLLIRGHVGSRCRVWMRISLEIVWYLRLLDWFNGLSWYCSRGQSWNIVFYLLRFFETWELHLESQLSDVDLCCQELLHVYLVDDSLVPILNLNGWDLGVS